VVPGSCGHANYTREQLTEIVEAYHPLGWQMACHVQGDKGVDTILDVYEEALKKHPRTDHRLRLEHVGAISDEQLRRAADLGVTCSIFVDQIHYWGDIIVDGLFGPEHGSRWMPCGSAVATGMRISLHNDPPVTPETNGLRPVRSSCKAIAEISKVVLECLGVAGPRRAVDSGRRVLPHVEEDRAKVIDVVAVVPERIEWLVPVSTSCFAHPAEGLLQGIPALRPALGFLRRVPLGRAPSLHVLRGTRRGTLVVRALLR
jgi:hypothetical protein